MPKTVHGTLSLGASSELFFSFTLEGSSTPIHFIAQCAHPIGKYFSNSAGVTLEYHSADQLSGSDLPFYGKLDSSIQIMLPEIGLAISGPLDETISPDIHLRGTGTWAIPSDD